LSARSDVARLRDGRLICERLTCDEIEEPLLRQAPGMRPDYSGSAMGRSGSGQARKHRKTSKRHAAGCVAASMGRVVASRWGIGMPLPIRFAPLVTLPVTTLTHFCGFLGGSHNAVSARASSFRTSSRMRNIVGRTYAAPAGRAVLFARAAAAAAATSWRTDASSSVARADIRAR